MKRIIKIGALCLGLGLFVAGCGSSNQTQEKNYPQMQQNQPMQNDRMNQNNQRMNQSQQQTTPQRTTPPVQNGSVNRSPASH